MSSISVAGDTSGSVTLSAPAIAGTTVLTLPSVSGTVLTSATGQTLTSPTITSPTITGAVISAMGSSVITSGTAVNSTSGTSITFTGIPSWTKRVTVMFQGVSTSGTSPVQIQLGSGSITTTGYLSGGAYAVNATGIGGSNSTTGMLTEATTGATVVRHGQAIITNISGNAWVMSSVQARSDSAGVQMGGGSITLSGVLDRINITTVNGTDTFDAGSINILYE